MFRTLVAASISLAAFVLPAPSVSAQTTPFAGCGTIVEGVTCPRLFQADEGGIWLLSDFAAFQVNDRVFVTGQQDPTCVTICMQGNGCISSNTIENCDPSFPFCLTGIVPLGCPCGNEGFGGHGCANSESPAGGVMNANGSTAAWPPTGTDTIILFAAKMTNTATSLFIQGDAQIASTPFGDGVRCIGGSLKRLAVKTNVAGVAQFPEPGDPSVSQRSAQLGDPILGSGQTRYYQTYYRDPDPGFCPAPTGSTFNITRALGLDW